MPSGASLQGRLRCQNPAGIVFPTIWTTFSASGSKSPQKRGAANAAPDKRSRSSDTDTLADAPLVYDVQNVVRFWPLSWLQVDPSADSVAPSTEPKYLM